MLWPMKINKHKDTWQLVHVENSSAEPLLEVMQ